jgi:hypothetical protein
MPDSFIGPTQTPKEIPDREKERKKGRLKHGSALFDRATIADGVELRPESVLFWSILLLLDQPSRKGRLGLEWVRASIGCDLFDV